MRKKVNYSLRIFFIITLLSIYILEPMNASAASSASTLAGLRSELTALQNKKKSNENKKKMNQNEINQKNQAIQKNKQEIENSEAKIVQAKQDIESTKKKITELENQVKELMQFYQTMNGDNAYLEFISDSSSMTDLIMRSDAVSELAEYNKSKLDEAENLIKENQQKQVDLKKYEKELEENNTSYQQRIETLGAENLQLSDISISIDDEIALQKATIKMYEDMGCGEKENLEVCVSRVASNGWLKPVVKGKISSLFGYRVLNGKTSYHSGIDIAVAEGTTVYSATNGVVIKTLRSSCGGNQVYVQSYVNGKPYTLLYAHLLSISVRDGQKLTNQSIIGYSGGQSTKSYDSCTFGAHLHLSVSQTVYKNYSGFVANLINPPGFPGKGAWFYSRTQWFG